MVYTFRKVILFTDSFAVMAKPWFIGRIQCRFFFFGGGALFGFVRRAAS